MAKENLTKIIEALKTEAVGRCRERLESAAQRARAIVKCERSGNGKDTTLYSEKEHGVTMLLKRKHGL